MIVILGFLLLLVAGGVAVAGVAANSGGGAATDSFVLFGQSVTGMSVGRIFLVGLVVGAVGMLGLSMLLGSFNRRTASRRSRRDLTASRRESAGLRDDRARLSRQLDDQSSSRVPVDAAGGPASDPIPDDGGRPARRPSLRERIGGAAHR